MTWKGLQNTDAWILPKLIIPEDLEVEPRTSFLRTLSNTHVQLELRICFEIQLIRITILSTRH